MTRLVLVHGAVTGPSAWDPLLPLLHGYDVLAPERPRTGSLSSELAWLASVATDATTDTAADTWVVGLSGGATLGLALVASGVPLAGAVLHEPAVGSLMPALLAPVASAFAAAGASGLGSALYGPSWSGSLCPPEAAAAAGAELAMFRSVEPARVAPAAGRVVVTYGAGSPAARRTAAEALLPLGCSIRSIPGAGHFAPYDAPDAFAAVVADVIRSERRLPPSA